MKIQDYFGTRRNVREFIKTGDEYSFEFQAIDDESITVKFDDGGRECLSGLYVSDDFGEIRFCHDPSIEKEHEYSAFDFVINCLRSYIGDLSRKQNIVTTISMEELDRYIAYLGDALFCADRDGFKVGISLSDKLASQIKSGEFVR